ncbi:helicase associated domain-containing protein [Streptomyces sp. NPDC058254]|uniref:helicase associated domain-containing protein n=1 Tax=Streptomyces sp. NPDC058254 TaxID=3346406 RepID=UPI0036DFF38B
MPHRSGDVIVQGEGLGHWVTAQRHGYEKLQSVQQWLLEHTLGIEPAGEEERPVQRTQDDKWVLNVAASQFHAREGHLNVPRKHVEHVPVDLAGPAATGRETTPEGTVPVALGMWIANTRRRADKLSGQRHAALDELSMRW